MSRETEDRLLDIIEFFIGMKREEASKPDTGFSQPPVRVVQPDGVSERSMEPEEVQDARWAYDAGILTKEELEDELKAAAAKYAVIELDDGVT